MEGSSSAKYVPTNSSITAHNLAIQFLYALKHLSTEQITTYGRLIDRFLLTYEFIEQPLQRVDLSHFIEAHINEILLKEKPNKTFQEESSWTSKIQNNIANEQLERFENTHIIVNNLNKILQYQNLDNIAYPPKIQEHLDKLNRFNVVFETSYQDSLDPVNVIINIDALNESIKNF